MRAGWKWCWLIGACLLAAPAAAQVAHDCSGTITIGATAQNAITPQPQLHGFILQNLSVTEPLWWSPTGPAVAGAPGSYVLPTDTATTFAGAVIFVGPPGFGVNASLSVIAATTTHPFSCTWW